MPKQCWHRAGGDGTSNIGRAKFRTSRNLQNTMIVHLRSEGDPFSASFIPPSPTTERKV
jgi:hypothetical protein